MIKAHYIIICLSVFLLSSISAIAQEPEKPKKKVQSFPLSISIVNQSWAFLGSKIFRMAPVYPGLSFGSEYHYRNSEKILFYQALEFGGFINNSAGSALYVNTNVGLRKKTKIGLTIDFSLGLGYFHGFRPSPIYSLNSQGDYEQVKDKGVGATSANFNLTLGYKIKKSQKGLTPFLGYQWMASTYYWSLITIRPSGLLKAGVRFNLK